MRIGITEILVILVIVLVVFGGGKLAGVGKALGQSIRDFKKEVKADDEPAKKEEDKGGDAK
ncbi:MAG TPA: twin-arginine translocase TatA/TatE family subunit [Candidatus Limiplasma pullicola]|jgi:sec-independent protein translocase protein TatA|nr:twin-arginine translocase TatA/TatE family subunit [Candidatus Limiplasma pullicola]HIU09371.1 twin-arginine translocase TatA/TatE family subunit [Candidatus Limiplasma pullistercoris]